MRPGVRSSPWQEREPGTGREPWRHPTPRHRAVAAGRNWRDDDKAPYAALNGDPLVMEHFPSTLTPAQSDEMVERMAASWAERGSGCGPSRCVRRGRSSDSSACRHPRGTRRSHRASRSVGASPARHGVTATRPTDRAAAMTWGSAGAGPAGRRDRQLHHDGEHEVAAGDGEARHASRPGRGLRPSDAAGLGRSAARAVPTARDEFVQTGTAGSVTVARPNRS